VGQRSRRRRADAAAGAGDKRHRAIKLSCHLSAPLSYPLLVRCLDNC
jgi:hypothetical protein